MAGLLNLAKAAGNIPAPKPSNDLLRAFHGSPHDFPPVDMIVNKETGKTYYVDTDRWGSWKNHPGPKVNPDGYEFIEHFPQGHFDNSKMGTGEGAQAFGHGSYLAGVEDVARGYRDQLKGNIVIRDDGVQKTYGDHITEIETAIKEKFPNLAPDNVRTTARSVVNDNLVPDDVQGMGAFDKTGYRAEDIYLEGIRANKGAKASKGSMYEVDIDASPDELIDYDLPMSEQSEVVQKALGHTVKNYEGNPEKALRDFLSTDYAKAFPTAMDVRRAQTILDDPDYDVLIDGQDWVDSQMRAESGSSFYNILGSNKGGSAYFRAAEKMGGREALSKSLSDKGIKGIRYKDGFSRGADGGTSNYVIFDDRIINISKKYGIPIPAAAAMLAGQSEEAEAGPIPIAAGARRILDPRFSVPVGEGGLSNVRKGLLDPMATVGAEITPRDIDTGPSFQLSDFEGQPYIISQSDRSAAGGILNAVGGTQIDPVDLRGGRDFMFENPGMAWASDPTVVDTLLERATQLKTDHKQNPLLLPYTMAPTGIDFATMPLDTMINFARSNMSKTNIKKLDRQIKKIIPKWGGVANPGSNAIFRDSTGDQRKMVADVIDKQFKDVKGGLSIAEARAVTSDANQYLSNDGSMVNIGRIDTSRPAIADSGHPTYKGGLPGEGVGTFQEPLDIRKFIANNGRVVTNKPNDIRAASINPALTQGIIDEKLLRSQEGSIDPRLSAGLAAGILGAGAALTPEEAEAGLSSSVLKFLREGETLSQATDRARLDFERSPNNESARSTYLEIRNARDVQGEEVGGILDQIDASYRGTHQPIRHDDDYAVRLDNLSQNVKGESGGYPEDFYSSNGQRYYAQGPRFSGDETGIANDQSYKAAIQARGNPETEVTMYRAVPDDKNINTINPGDFVTLSPKYAELHSRYEDGKVLSKKVKVKDIYWAQDDVNEYGYFPDAGSKGSIDPRLVGGVAAGSAATVATPTLADQGAGIMDFLANAAQGAIAPISNAPHTIIQALTSDRSNEQLKADRDARLVQNDYQLRTDLGQQYTQNAQQTMGGLLQYLKEQAERSRIFNAAKNSRILQTIPNAYNQLPERGRIVGNALLDSFL